MERHTLTLEAQAGGNPDAFLSSLVEFCVDSVTVCLSPDAEQRCVPVGLCSLSALLLLLACCLLVYQRCTLRGENPGESITFLYSLLGSLCSTTGAILSRQLHIQVLMGAFAAAMDAVSLISCCFHVLLCWNSKTVRRQRMRRRRRRQHLLAACVLMVVAGGFLKSKVNQHPADQPLSIRRLLQVTLHDNTEFLGYTLGLLSFVIASTSRFPALCRAYRGQMLTCSYMLSVLLCSLAGSLYAAAILLHDTQLGFLLRVMLWLLSAICCVTLDLLIFVISWWKRGTRQQITSVSSDTESLLGGSEFPVEDNGIIRKQQVHSTTRTKKKKVQKMTEMGRYMDVSVQPAAHICLKEVTLSEKEVEERPLNRTVRMIRVDGFCSSDSSCDSSVVSSDLEVGWTLLWDFEEANAKWSESTAKQQEWDEFPPQEWPTNPKPFNICTCAMLGPPQDEGILAKPQKNVNLKF